MKQRIFRKQRRFASGQWARAECPRCGLEVKYTKLRKEWTGIWVCPDCLDPYPPQENIIIPTDAQGLEHPQPSTYAPQYDEDL